MTDVASERNKFKLGGKLDNGYWHVIDETIDEAINCNYITKPMINEFISEYEGNVDLSSFRPQKQLNEKIWINDRLNSKVRMRLLDIADEFISTLNVDWAKYKDIILTGSLANYNWSKFSDFDLHILYDFNDIDKRTEFVKEYMDSKKKIWNDDHSNIKIYGFPVELYVQDINEKHTASGVYSIEKDKWLVTPEKDNIKAIMLNKYFIKEKVGKFIDKIDELDKSLKKEKDTHKIEEIGNKANLLFKKLKAIRKEGLEKSGEMSSGNIIYKVLRRMNYLDKLFDIKYATFDKIKSLKQ